MSSEAGGGDQSTHTVYVGPSKLGAKDADRVHFLVIESGNEPGRRVLLEGKPIRIGREAPADLVLSDPGISRSHCRIEPRFDTIVVTDLGSTNGSYIDGRQVQGTMLFPVGATLQIGQHVLQHAVGTRREFEASNMMDQELEEALRYVHALIPKPWTSGPVRTQWLMLPSTRLGGDILGHHALDDDRYAFYLVDVSGHGARAAMHGASVLNAIRHHAVPGVDFGKPSDVLRGLNDMFDMQTHGEMYFTIWYGVYDRRGRTLAYGSGGHHPAYLVDNDRGNAAPLHTRNIPIGTMPGYPFKEESATIPEGACVYVFSDGVFELVGPGGRELGLGDFVPLLLEPLTEDEPRRLHKAASRLGGRDTFDDDFTILVAAFD